MKTDQQGIIVKHREHKNPNGTKKSEVYHLFFFFFCKLALILENMERNKIINYIETRI